MRIPIIWGLDLAEIHYVKFGHHYMWNKVYHLRRSRFIWYQLAMILCVISESLGTAVLVEYQDQTKLIRTLGFPETNEWVGDYVGIASYNIFNGIYVAFIFGAGFFFDLIWPERREDRGIRRAWMWTGISTIFTTLASAIGMTVVFASHSAIISGPADQVAQVEQALKDMGEQPITYRYNNRAIASMAFLWAGWLCCIVAAYYMWVSTKYVEKYGPFTTTEREARLIGPGSMGGRPLPRDFNPANIQSDSSTDLTATSPGVSNRTASDMEKANGASFPQPGSEGYDHHAVLHPLVKQKIWGGGPTGRDGKMGVAGRIGLKKAVAANNKA